MARRIAGWDEEDVHTGWRRYLKWTGRPGATSKVKRRTRRRERREGKAGDVEALPHRSRKDTRRWCRGKPGVEHQLEMRLAASEMFHEHVCTVCRKTVRWTRVPGSRWPWER